MDRRSPNRTWLHELALHYLGHSVYRPRPRVLLFSPLMQCNHKCAHCGIWRNKKAVPKQIDPERFATLLADEVFDNLHALWIGGGEPTMHAELVQFYRSAIEARPELDEFGLITNGSLPDKVERTLQALREAASPTASIYLHLSLDGPPETHLKVRGVDTAWERVTESARRLRAMRRTDSRLQLVVNCVIQPQNADPELLEKVAEIAVEWGAGATFNLIDRGDGFYCNRDVAEDLRFTAEQERAIADWLDARVERQRIHHPLKGHYNNISSILRGGARTYRCSAMASTFHLDSDGAVWPCPVAAHLPIGNVLGSAPGAIWHGADARARIREVRGRYCDRCGLSCSLGQGKSLGEVLLSGE